MGITMRCHRLSRGLMRRFLLRLLDYRNDLLLVKRGMVDRRTFIHRVSHRLLGSSSRCLLDSGVDLLVDRYRPVLCLHLVLHRHSSKDHLDMLEGGKGRCRET